MATRFAYIATWHPGIPLQLGDIGHYRNRQFFRIKNLKDVGINFNVRPDTSADHLNHESATGVSMTLKAKGEATAPGSSIDKATSFL